MTPNSQKEIIVTTSGIRIKPFIKASTCPRLLSLNGIFDNVHRCRIPFSGHFINKSKTYAMYHDNTYFLHDLLPDYQIKYEAAWPTYNYPAIPFKVHDSVEFTDLQIKTINQATMCGSDRVFINLQTGRGKTLVTIELIGHQKKKAIIFCYSTKVLDQWGETLKEFTDIDPKRILRVHSLSMVLSIANGTTDVSNYDIFLMTPMLATMFAEKYDWETFAEFIKNLHVGIKVYDEAHRNIRTMILIDAFTSIEKTYYLSADFAQATNEKEKLFYRIFWDVPVINPVVDDIDLDYVNVCCVDYNSQPSTNEIINVHTKRGFSNFNYMRYEYSKEYIFNALDAIIDAITKHNVECYKILILTSMIEHVDLLYDYLKKYENDYSIGKYYGPMNDKEKQNNLIYSEMLISTYSSFGVGVDARNIQYVISMDQVDRITDNQAAGRARPIKGRKAYYFMINDMGFDHCVKASKKRISYLKSSKANSVFMMHLGDEKR